MKDPRHDEFGALRRRAVEIGRNGETVAHRELLGLLKSEFPIVRKAAAGALVKLLERTPSLAGVCRVPLFSAIRVETGEQVLQYMLKAFLRCAGTFTGPDLDLLRDLARDPSRKDYVRAVASEAVAAGAGVCAVDPLGVRLRAQGEDKKHCRNQREYEGPVFHLYLAKIGFFSGLHNFCA